MGAGVRVRVQTRPVSDVDMCVCVKVGGWMGEKVCVCVFVCEGVRGCAWVCVHH